MYKFYDLVSFLFTTAIVVGTFIVIALLVHAYSDALQATKSSLEKRGWKVSSHGMSVPVGKRKLHDRENYLDATQRGLSRAANASTFGAAPRLASPSSRDPAGQWSGVRSANASAPNLLSGEAEHRHHRLHLFKRHMD